MNSSRGQTGLFERSSGERLKLRIFPFFFVANFCAMSHPGFKMFFVFLFLMSGQVLQAQSEQAEESTVEKKAPRFLSLEPAPAFDKKRFWVSAGTGTVVYTGVSIALWNAWYKDFPLTEFHTFNDLSEWRGMDKGGHLFSTWMEANFVFHGARWTGIDRRKAMWTGVGVGMGLQATVEIMDGFSKEWGFSWADIGFNTLGAFSFAAQEMAWEEQRIVFKVSGDRPNYSTAPIYSADGSFQTTLDDRATELYGSLPHEVILKDYNALTVWASANVHSFLSKRQQNRFPEWLNLAFGYGAGNLYGGFENKWETDEEVEFFLDDATYPRYTRFLLSPDVDLTRIPTRKRWLKFALGVLNVFKIPAPAVEFNTLGETRFHALYW